MTSLFSNNVFITSHTKFTSKDYSDAPVTFIKKLGFDKQQWAKEDSVTLLRASILDPYLKSDELFDYYTTAIKRAFEQRLTEVL